jgi:uncharacterized protein (TIGR01777 family)
MSTPQMTVAISGASGLIGGALADVLRAAGHRVLRLVRRLAASDDEIEWNDAVGIVEAGRLAEIDAVIHLAGENIASGRWSRWRMERIRTSRVAGTRAIVASLARVSPPPKAFLCASAIGFYGNRGDEVLAEQSPPGHGFLAELCQAWEQEAAVAAQHGMRWVSLRFGVVLTPLGGMLKQVLPQFKRGVGGRVGGGRQYMSWIALDDVVGAVRHVLANTGLTGPVNIVSPQPVTNAEFTSILARVLGKSAGLPVPAMVLRLAVGKMADEMLLVSTRVHPERLTESGYQFRHPELEPALRQMLTPGVPPPHD